MDYPPSMAEYIQVCKTSDIADGEMKVFNKDFIEFLVYQKNGEYFSIYNKCPHMGGSLGDGHVDDSGFITCPLHFWQFDPKTGKAPDGYSDFVPTFELKIEGDDILINSTQLKSLAQNKSYAVLANHDSKERFERAHNRLEKDYDDIQAKAKWRSNSIQAMRTMKSVPGFEHIQFKAAQLAQLPLLPEESVSMKTVIGPNAKVPLELDLPFYISHMSFGALSREAKIALATGANKMGTAMCSGEGGRHPEEFKAAGKYIYEIGTACFTRKEEWIKEADAIEIKIGQAAKPGLGGHLPQHKITQEIADLRGIPRDKDQISPARFPDINNKEDLKKFVSQLREQSGGKPIGVKFAAGHVEGDLDVALYAEPDFITIDGRGGGTGAAPTFVKDNFAMPIVYALSRARNYLDEKGSKISLIATGGFRTSGDISKALAMGADAVALATAPMMAIGCQQYRACHTGNCPVGVATQEQKLRDRFDIESSTVRLVNFFEVMKHEIVEITQAIGKDNVHSLNYADLLTTDNNISENTPIEHA